MLSRAMRRPVHGFRQWHPGTRTDPRTPYTSPRPQIESKNRPSRYSRTYNFAHEDRTEEDLRKKSVPQYRSILYSELVQPLFIRCVLVGSSSGGRQMEVNISAACSLDFADFFERVKEGGWRLQPGAT